MKGDEVVDEYVNGTYSPRIDIDTTGKTVLTFKYEAGENDVGGAWLNALARNSGLVIIVR